MVPWPLQSQPAGQQEVDADGVDGRMLQPDCRLPVSQWYDLHKYRAGWVLKCSHPLMQAAHTLLLTVVSVCLAAGRACISPPEHCPTTGRLLKHSLIPHVPCWLPAVIQPLTDASCTGCRPVLGRRTGCRGCRVWTGMVCGQQVVEGWGGGGVLVIWPPLIRANTGQLLWAKPRIHQLDLCFRVKSWRDQRPALHAVIQPLTGACRIRCLPALAIRAGVRRCKA